MVWATTPLAIKISAQALPPVAAATARMAVAVVVGLALLWLMGGRLTWTVYALRSYAAALPGVFAAMVLAYLSTPYVPSGLISVVFGMAPLMSGVMMQLLPEPVKLNSFHWFGCVLGVLGLAWVFMPGVYGYPQLGMGLLLLVGAVIGFSLSGVLTKHFSIGLPPLEHTLGALILSLPCYGITSLLLDESMEIGQLSGLWAIAYLSVFGSLLGFVAYYYVLARMNPASVSLITLITPILALMLGAVFYQEPLQQSMIVGVLMIICALGLYFLGDRSIRRVIATEASR
jgi:drug/metabolite transporter (DMT)-like permease